MISIIVPVYKVEKYLSKCIESLINQTYKDIEIILVDDGSPDGCPQICDAYAQKDHRIVVIHQQNRGVSVARNVGLNVARGEFIGFVDPDDWVAPEMYEGLYEAIQHEKADFSICGYDYYDEQGNLDKERAYLVQPNEKISQKEVMNRFADMPPTVRHGVCNKLFKVELLGSTRFIEGLHSSEDVYFLNDYVKKIKNAVVVHQPYYKNLVRQGSATHGGLSIASLADSFSAHDKMYKDTVAIYPELQEHALAFLMDVCVLKYFESKKKLEYVSEKEEKDAKKRIHEMLIYIKKHAWKALFDKEIYWKTRVMYLLLK